MPDHFEDAISTTLTASVAIQALACVMAEGSDHPHEADAVRQLAVQIEDALRDVTARASLGEREWRTVSDPTDGVMVAAGDLLIDVAEMGRFEDEHELMRRPHAGKGPEPKYDWDAFWRAVAIYVHQHGVPPTLKEFTEAMSNWFLDQTNGAECPSDSVIRKKLSPLWNELRREA